MKIEMCGMRYCPNCKKVLETRVTPEGYKQVVFRGVPVKRRKIVCGKNRDGLDGCGHFWFTFEVPEFALTELSQDEELTLGDALMV